MSSLTKILNTYQNERGALLPVLHQIQAEIGYIPEEHIDEIASALKLSRAEVFGVIHFYHDFKTTEQGAHILKICRAESCQSMGAESLIRSVLSAFGLEDFGTTADGKVTVEAVYCLGLCAVAPAVLLDNQPIARPSIEQLKGRMQ